MPDNGQPAQSEQGGEGQKPQEEDKLITLPESILRGYVQQVNESVRKAEEERAKEIAKLKAEFAEGEKKRNEEIEAFKRRPLSDWAKDMDKEAEAVILKKMKSGAINNAIEDIVTPVVINKTIEMQNKIDGTHMETVDEIGKAKDAKRRRNRRRNRILGGVGVLGLTAVAVVAGWALYDSSKRTAEGAAGVADSALKISSETRVGFNSYKTADAKWKTDYDATKKSEDEARAKATGELEKKLTGEIAKKADKTELTTQIADVKKNYTTLNAIVNAELAKNNAREEAYGEFKKLADATKTSLDDLGKRFGDLEGKSATREYTDEELGKLRKNLADAEGNIKRYGGLIVQLQTEGGVNSKESTDLRKLYDGLLKNYQAIADRMKKIEEENKNYQPPARDR